MDLPRTVVVLLLAAAGCAPVPALAPPPAPPPTVTHPLPVEPAPPPAPIVAPDERPPVALHLDAAPAFEVLAAMEGFGAEPVLVDATALASLRCAVVSVGAPDPIPPRVAAEKIAEALRAQHYRIDHHAGQWTVSPDPEAAPAACAPPAPPPRADKAAELAAAELERAVRRVSDTEYVITRRGVDLLLTESSLLSQARIVPERSGDKIVGIRIFAIRPDAPLARLGLLNGDRLTKVSGYDITNPERALEAYSKLRNAKRMVLELVRRGATVKILYRVE